MTAGIVRADWHGEEIKRIQRKAAVAGLKLAAAYLFDITQVWVPVNTGALKASGRVELIEAALEFRIHYGEGLDDPRATINHEKPEIAHPNGRAKYVELPMRQHGREAGNILAARIRAAMT